METLVRWLVGLIFALGVGQVTTWYFLRWLRGRLKLNVLHSDTDELPVPGWLVGVVERLFFVVAVAFNVSGAAIAMIAWIAVKMVTNWNRVGQIPPESPRAALTGLIGGLVSMLFALIGGLICSGQIG